MGPIGCSSTTNEIPLRNYFALLSVDEEAPQPFLPDELHDYIPDEVALLLAPLGSGESHDNIATLSSTPATSHQTTINRRLGSSDILNCVALFAATNENVRRSAWIFDSGANVHIVNSMSFVTKFESFNINVGTADEGGSMQVLGDATVKLPLLSTDGKEQTNLTIKECLYIPSSRCNLISLSKLAEGTARLSGVWDNDHISICFGGQNIGVADNREGLYYIRLANADDGGANDPDKLAMVIDFKDKAWQWHFRLGHPSWESMIKLVANSEGMDVTVNQIKGKRGAVCPVCQTTKATYKIPREPARRRATRSLEMVHIDTWGPYPVVGSGNIRSFLLITDDFSRFTWGVALVDRAGLAQRTINTLKRIQNKHNTKVCAVRLDHEIAQTDVFRIWARENGVDIEPTTPYAHYQNGVAERKNRTVRDVTTSITQQGNMSHVIVRGLDARTREILANTRMPEELWPWAYQHAIWLRNRLTTRANPDHKTPWEMIYDVLPDLSVEKTWGSRVYVTIPHETQGPKLHQRAWPGHHIGHESEAIHLVYDPALDVVKRTPPSRVAEREAIDDVQETPSLQDRIPDWDAPIAGNNSESSSSSRSGGRSAAGDDQDGESDFDDGASDLHIPPNQIEGDLSASSTSPSPGAGLETPMNGDSGPEPDMYPIGSANSESLSQSFDAQGQLFTNAWDVTDGAGYGMYDGDDDGRDFFTQHVVLMAIKQGNVSKPDVILTLDNTTPCEKYGLQCLPYTLKPTHEGRLCSTCRRNLPEATVCARCKIPASHYSNSSIGKICPNCEQRRRTDPDDEDRSLCTLCRQGTTSTIPSIHGTICGTCARKIPNPEKCPICHKGANRWRHSLQGKVCRTCYSHFAHPAGADCENCQNYGLVCGTSRPCQNCIENGLKCRKKQAGSLNKVDKCDKCAKKKLYCNGERPCNNCKFKGHCIPFGTKKPEKCSRCASSSRDCVGRPCVTCQKEGLDYCTEYDTEDLILLKYPISKKALDACAKRPEECRGCRKQMKTYRKRGMNPTVIQCGPRLPGTPCLRCIKNKHVYGFCSWDEDDTLVKVPTAPWFVVEDEDGHETAVLDTTYKSWTKEQIREALSRGGIFSTTRTQSQLEDANALRRTHKDRLIEGIVVDDGEETQSGRKRRRIAPSIQSTFIAPTSEAQQEAWAAFQSLFPNGVDTIPTDSTGLQCAFYAVINSLQSMSDRGINVPVSTLSDLQEVYNDQNFQTELRAYEVGYANAGQHTYRIDQVGVVINWWATIFHNTPLRLGWVLSARRPILTAYQDLLDTDIEPTYVFIHNDSRGRDEDLNHFSGLRPRSVPIPIDPALLQDPTNEEDRDADDPPNNAEDDIIDIGDISVRDSGKATRAKLDAFRFAGLTITDLASLPTPNTYTEAKRAPDAKKWIEATEREYSGLVENNTWTETTLPPGKQAITVRWVYTRKLGPDGNITKWKARMVARGFQQIEGVDYFDSYAPVAKHSSYRILFAIAAALGWHMMQTDITSAFLNSSLKEEVYIRPPPGYPCAKGVVLKLGKALYGLKQASRAWYLTLVAELKKLGWRVSRYDDCVFIHKKLNLFLLVWVDDFIFLGLSVDSIKSQIESLSLLFKMTDEGICTWYLGMNIEH